MAVGDVEANRDEEDVRDVVGPPKHRRLGEFPAVLDGTVVLPAPLWFIGGNHEPWPGLDRAGPGEWAPGVHFLGRAGTARVAGLRPAFVSGIYSTRVSEGRANSRRTPKERTYWVRREIEAVLAVAGAGDPVDVVVTHDWPAGLTCPRARGAVGHPALRELTEGLRPQVHVCGHMHFGHRETVGPTVVHCLPTLAPGPTAIAVFERQGDGRLVELSAPSQP